VSSRRCLLAKVHRIVGEMHEISLSERDLVAIDLDVDAAWIQAVREAWASGAAVLPLDRRLDKNRRRDLALQARATHYLDEAGIESLPDGAPTEPGTAVVIATSGSTGQPKLVELSKSAVSWAAEASLKRLGESGAKQWILTLPVSHIGGFMVAVRAMLFGLPLHVQYPFEPHRLKLAPRKSAISVVPTMLRRMLEAGVDLTRFGVILVGGSRLDPAIRLLAERSGGRVVETYGSTETCGGVVYEGRPLDGVKVEIEPSADSVGRIKISSPSLMTGYRRLGPGSGVPANSEATYLFGPGSGFSAGSEAGASPGTSPNYFLMPDVGRLSEDGTLEVIGRADDAITSGGETFFPAPIEEVLARHPLVADVAVTGVPDAEWGEVCIALVVPRHSEGLENERLAADLKAHAASELPPYQVPKKFVFVKEIVRTELGKARQDSLRSAVTEPDARN
jgi:o-succinylbenzoate---CoA ligase